MFKYILLLLLAVQSTPSLAQDSTEYTVPAELQNFEAFADILPVDEYGQARGAERTTQQLDIIPFILAEIKNETAFNIMNAEQVFCYHVTRRPQDYTGYTLNRYALTGYCGELDKNQIATSYEALFTNRANVLTIKSDCRIEPRIMLRFVRGVDYTDVLLSSPCHSFTVFYAGKYHSFNIKKQVIDDIINQLEKKNEKFNSPALLKKTIANAEADTTAEEEILEKKQKESQPIMNWQQQQEQAAREAAEKPATSGWGKINLKIKRDD